MTYTKTLLASLIASSVLVGCGGGSGGGSKNPVAQLPLADGVFQESMDTKIYFTPYAEYAGEYARNCSETYNDYYFESENFLVYGPRSLPETDFRYAAHLAEEGYAKILPEFGFDAEIMKMLRPSVSPEFMRHLDVTGIFGGLPSIHVGPDGKNFEARITFDDNSEFEPDAPGSHLAYSPIDANGDLIEREDLAANHFYAWFSALTHEEQRAVIHHRIPDSFERAIELTKQYYGPDQFLENKIRTEIIEPLREADNGPFMTKEISVGDIDLVPEKYMVCLNQDMPAASGIKGQSTFYGMNLIPQSYYGDRDLQKVVDHEIVHMITANISHRLTAASVTDAWWEEGLAVKLSGQHVAHPTDTPTDVTRFTRVLGVVNSGMDLSTFYAHSGLAISHLLTPEEEGGPGNTVDFNFVNMLLMIRQSEKSFQLTQDDHIDENGNYIEDRNTHAYPAFEQAFDAAIYTRPGGQVEGLDAFKSDYTNRVYE